MSQTNQQKATQIISALALPQGHYAVQENVDGELVAEVELSKTTLDGTTTHYTDRWMCIYVSTAVWFQLYESTESGIVWTLCLPDPNKHQTRCDHPYLEYELLGITIRAMYSIAGVTPGALSKSIWTADDSSGIPVIRFE